MIGDGLFLTVIAVLVSVFTIFIVGEWTFQSIRNQLSGNWIRRSKGCVEVNGKTVLLTGGSQGLGFVLASKLAARGANVIVVARNEEKLARAVEKIRASARDPTTQRFTYISADVCLNEENLRIFKLAMDWNDQRPPDIIWACAGMSHPGLFMEVGVDLMKQQMELNYWASVYLLKKALSVWLKRTVPKHAKPESRHFIFTSSTLAYCGITGYSPYSPCKAALRSLSDTMRQELRLYEGAGYEAIHVHLVTPGNILTPGFEAENLLKHGVTRRLEEGDQAMTADLIAERALRALERGDYLVTTNMLGYTMKCAALHGSPRNGIGVGDTVFAMIANFLYLLAGPDMERVVFKWGQQHGAEAQGSSNDLSTPSS